MAFKKQILGAAAVAGLALGATLPAQAYIVCDRDGDDCWHSEARYRAPGVTFEYHPDDWYFHRHWDGDRYHWRDYHEGRGYYRNGVWITL